MTPNPSRTHDFAGRRAAAEAAVHDEGRLRVEHDNYYASCGGQIIRLPRTESLLLSRLAMNAGRVVESAQLWHHAWGGGKVYNPDSLHTIVYRLRLKLSPSASASRR